MHRLSWKAPRVQGASGAHDRTRRRQDLVKSLVFSRGGHGRPSCSVLPAEASICTQAVGHPDCPHCTQHFVSSASWWSAALLSFHGGLSVAQGGGVPYHLPGEQNKQRAGLEAKSLPSARHWLLWGEQLLCLPLLPLASRTRVLLIGLSSRPCTP